ncbi:SurA N-terminal domain-containing protein [Aquibacillus albus]|uniref:SurA N-terminal domain-containing protein n=1 Tax=Aquibacillus albus TaxID=1168171 RepID=UPI00195977B6|nr:SurA N-terminal domain-containing protein [Aquibacillus albus]
MTLNKKWLLSLTLAGIVTFTAACGNEGETTEDNNEEAETQEEEVAAEQGAEEGGEGGAGEGAEQGAEQPKMPEPDLEGIPDVVAVVNGEEISKEEFQTVYEGQFQRAAMQSQMSGQEVNQDQLKQQIAESMIGQELLIQEANNSGFEASQEDIDETLNGLVEQNGLESKDEFMAALEEQGMDEAEVMSQLEIQVKLDQLIASESGDIEPTEEELEEAYEQVKAQQEQMGGDSEVPSFEEVKPNLKQQLKSQKEAQVIQTLVEELRQNADVTVNL